ncbi:MAG: DNA-3-methyladenine glycosylase 2 family protein [Dehalococcoidia bacterium]|nr:DNA-3-methyladenine glycosylase 2 family protein [Dehalococcoidia bacterium]
MTDAFQHPQEAVEHLRRSDSVMATVIDAVGPPAMRAPSESVYEALGRAILYQQLAGAAATAIMIRFKRIYAPDEPEGRFPEPGELIATDDETLRASGLSRQKLSYLKDLAAHVLDGGIVDDEIAALSDEEIIERVSSVKGIGRWTAEMLLIFHLQRPDVLPVDDLGVRNAFRRLYNLPEAPKAPEMIELAEPWRPYRSLGTWYLWQSFDFNLMGETNVPGTRAESTREEGAAAS